MKAAILSCLFLLSLHLSFAQAPLYQQKSVIGSTPVLDMVDMAMDTEDNLYLLDLNRVLKMKEGEVVMEFNINKEDYLSPNASNGRILANMAVDQQQQIYILNLAKKHVEKYDRNGNLLEILHCPGDETIEYYYHWALSIDNDNNLNIFDTYARKIFVYDTEGNYIRTISLADPDPVWSSIGVHVAFDKDNNIYIAETKKAYWNTTLYLTLLNQDGEIIKRFDEDYIKSSGLTEAQGMQVAPDGDIYFYKFRSPVYVFSPSGDLKEKIPPISQVYFPNFSPNSGAAYLCFDSQHKMYLGNYNPMGSTVYIYDQNHQLQQQQGNLRWPVEVDFDTENNLYILNKFTKKIIKTNHEGEELLEFGGAASDMLYPLRVAIDDKNYVYVLEGNSKDATIRKHDASGNVVAYISGITGSFGTGTNPYDYAGMAVDHHGDIYISGYNNFDNFLSKYDAQGKLIRTFDSGKGPGQLWRPLDVTVDAAGNVFVLDLNGKRIQKFSSTGKFIQQFGSFNPDEADQQMRGSISSDALGNIVTATAFNINGYFSDFKVNLYDLKGQLVSSLPDGTPSVAMSRDGNFIATAANYKDVVTLYESSSPRAYNFIEGNIYHDQNANCVMDANETGLADILVKAEPGPLYGVTDASGNYRLAVGKGNFTVEALTENRAGKLITPTCVTGDITEGVQFDSYGNYSTGNLIGTKVTLSPFLSASVSSDRRRRCFESTTKVTYSNTGFAPAENAKVHLQLPEQVELLSANKPYTRLPDGTYVFEVGTVAAGETKTITIQDKVVCGDESIRGLTVCTKVWLTPGNYTPTAVSAVTGICDYGTGYVRFVIRNTGATDMEAGQQFRIYRDGQLTTVEDYRLAAGDSMVLRIPAMGRTVRVEADQPNGNGDNILASATVEACSSAATPTPFSTGFVNILPTDDEEAEVAEECLPIIDSFDPNDKLVTPIGRTEENYTPTGVALKYKIRFQNTGTDVAYRVVVVDTLSGHLDISTLQMGGASHAYTFDVSGKGQPVLTWTFDNIMLPDSTSNEPGSHGYIQFSIKPKADLPEKTAVANYADIFFDFNSPVRTNITLNRIFDMPPVIAEENRLAPEEVIASPVITAFSPAAGKIGSTVLIQGRNFSTIQEENQVWLNGIASTVTHATATALHVLVPQGATTGKLKVQTRDGATQSLEAYTVYQPPLLTAFSPAEGVAGTEVTLQGSFLAEGELESVLLGALDCEVLTVTQQELVVRIPEGALTENFRIITKGGEAQSAAAFVVWYQPVISSLSKETDKVGSELEITGEHFAPAALRNKVLFGLAQAEVLQASAAVLKVRVPAGAVSGPVTVETPGGQASSAVVFEVIPAPVLFSFSPASGSVGTVVELKGEHFLTLGQQDTIYFGNVKAVVLSASETNTVVRVPRGAQTGKVQVAGIGGKAVSATDFVVEDLTPQQAISVYPNPTTGTFIINFIKADFDVKQVEIMNTIGSSVYSQEVMQGHQLEVNLPRLSAGLYLIQLSTSRGTVTKKINLL